MTPRQFLDSVVRPNVNDFHDHYGDLRHAYNAISAIDALAAHLYEWAKANAPAEVSSSKDDSEYRNALASMNDSFRLLRDMAKAQKHVRLMKHNPLVKEASQITSRPIGLGEGGFGMGRFGGPPQVVVDIGAGSFSYVEAVVDDALAFLESEMNAIGA